MLSLFCNFLCCAWLISLGDWLFSEGKWNGRDLRERKGGRGLGGDMWWVYKVKEKKKMLFTLLS